MLRKRLSRIVLVAVAGATLALGVLVAGLFNLRYQAAKRTMDDLQALGSLVYFGDSSPFPAHESMMLWQVEEYFFPPEISEVYFHGDWSPPIADNYAFYSYTHFETESLDDEKLAALVEILRPLKPCPKLTFIGTMVTDEGLKELQKLPALTELDLTGTRISGRGIASLAGIPIKTLVLSHTQLSDSALPTLARFTTLETLDVSHTQITAVGVEQLRGKLPNCQVIYKDSSLP